MYRFRRGNDNRFNHVEIYPSRRKTYSVFESVSALNFMHPLVSMILILCLPFTITTLLIIFIP